MQQASNSQKLVN